MRLRDIYRIPLMMMACPNYRKDMPTKDEPGKWVAVAIRYSSFHERESRWVDVMGLRNAYREARWQAMWEDFWCESSACIGIRWAVRRPTQ